MKKYGLKTTFRDTSLYIVSITLVSIILLLTGIFFIDRIINYIPTLSGVYYNVTNLTNISIVLIMTLLLIRLGYMERTGILLYRLDNIFNHMLSLVGVKIPPNFSIIDGERDQWSLDKSYRKAYDIVKTSGGSDEKAKEFGNRVADKLAEFKKIQRTTDSDKIMKLSTYDLVIGTESSSGSSQNSNNSSLTTLNPNISQQYTIPPHSQHKDQKKFFRTIITCMRILKRLFKMQLHLV